MHNNSRRANQNIDAPLSQPQQVRNELRLEDTAKDWISLFCCAQVESLTSKPVSVTFHKQPSGFAPASRL